MTFAAIHAFQRMDRQFLGELEDAAGTVIPRLPLLEIRTAVAHFYFLCLQRENRPTSGAKRRKQDLQTLRRAEKLCNEIDRRFRGEDAEQTVASLRAFIKEKRNAGRRFPALDHLVLAVAKACRGIIGRSSYSPTGPLARILRKVWEILPPAHRGGSADAFAKRADKIRKYYSAGVHQPAGVAQKL
jgi:hypothetical protein